MTSGHALFHCILHSTFSIYHFYIMHMHILSISSHRIMISFITLKPLFMYTAFSVHLLQHLFISFKFFFVCMFKSMHLRQSSASFNLLRLS